MNKFDEYKLQKLNNGVNELRNNYVTIRNDIDYVINRIDKWRKESDDDKLKTNSNMVKNMVKDAERIKLDTAILKIIIELLK